MNTQQWRNDNSQRNPKAAEKNYPGATSSTTKAIWTTLGLNQGLRRD